MHIPFSKKTRKNYKQKNNYLDKTIDAKKGTQIKCMLKSCRAKKYQSVYGLSTGGRIRATIPIYY